MFSQKIPIIKVVVLGVEGVLDVLVVGKAGVVIIGRCVVLADIVLLVVDWVVFRLVVAWVVVLVVIGGIVSGVVVVKEGSVVSTTLLKKKTKN